MQLVPTCGSRDGVEAHHLGPTDADGGIALCRRHHRLVTATENKARSKLRAVSGTPRV
jgi:hypothetical protein